MKLEELAQKEKTVRKGLRLNFGRVRAEVKTAEGLRHDFTVRSAVATAAVRGTEFEFDCSAVDVFSEVVVLSNPVGQSQSVAGGERSVTTGYETPLSPEGVKIASMRVSRLKSAFMLTLLVAVFWNCEYRQPGTPVSTALAHLAVSRAPLVLDRIELTVSGEGMDTIERTLPGSTTDVTIEVPAGSGRRFEAQAYHWVDLLLCYAGSATVDLAPGETTSVTIDMTAPILDAFVANYTNQPNKV